MKFLQITEEIERSLVIILDLALKAQGMSALPHIDAVRNSVQNVINTPVPSPTKPQDAS